MYLQSIYNVNRSILDSMKSFAADESPIDIEELNKLRCVNKCKNESGCNYDSINSTYIKKDNLEWYSPTTLNELLELLAQYQNLNHRIIAANTGTGIYKNDGPFDAYINIRNVLELHKVDKKDSSLVIGSQITLTKLIQLFETFSKSTNFEYLSEVSSHLKRIANVSVRNVGTWAGNLMIKVNHNDFASDVFVLLETINASIKLVGPNASPIEVSPANLLNTPTKGKIIHSMTLKPFYMTTTIIKTYKIMPRSQNSHAYVNAGFNFKFANESSFVVQSCSIVFGGISASLVHATSTEKFLLNKSLDDEAVMSEAFRVLYDELNPDDEPVLSSVEYRKSLAVSLLYKFALFVNQKKLSPRFKSSFLNLNEQRPISSGSRDFPTNEKTYPVSQPMPKRNALLQASGEV